MTKSPHFKPDEAAIWTFLHRRPFYIRLIADLEESSARYSDSFWAQRVKQTSGTHKRAHPNFCIIRPEFTFRCASPKLEAHLKSTRCKRGCVTHYMGPAVAVMGQTRFSVGTAHKTWLKRVSDAKAQ
jgi:hypothetical protein